MEVFDFPFHVLGERRPESSAQVRYGNGYQFASAPRGPDQIEFNLSFETMLFFEQEPGVLDLSVNPKLNIGLLDHFYDTHRLYRKFIYPHGFRGDVVVRFAKALEWKIRKGGHGSVEPFTISLILQP